MVNWKQKAIKSLLPEFKEKKMAATWTEFCGQRTAWPPYAQIFRAHVCPLLFPTGEIHLKHLLPSFLCYSCHPFPGNWALIYLFHMVYFCTDFSGSLWPSSILTANPWRHAFYLILDQTLCSLPFHYLTSQLSAYLEVSPATPTPRQDIFLKDHETLSNLLAKTVVVV